MAVKKKRIKTKENWHPAFETPGGWEVEVALHKDATGKWRVSVWGNDDFGLETHNPGNMNQSDALDLFRNIGDFITQQELYAKGFTRA